MLGPSHRETSDCYASKLYENHLHDESEHKNADEKPVVKESFENINLISEFTTVDLVEYLHEDKTLEQNCVDESLVRLSFSWGTVAHEASIRPIW